MNGLIAIPARRSRLLHAVLGALAVCVAFLLPATAEAARDKALEKRLRDHIAILASDDFAGRQPGTEGEAMTLRYLGRQWFDLGLQSGTNDPGNPWFAPVTLVAREPGDSRAQFLVNGRHVPVSADEMLLLTSGKRSLVRNAPMLFVGRADRPEYSRNELAGRVAVVLDADEEGSQRQDALLEQGASAVITVLDGSRSLAQVAARRKRTGYALSNDVLGGDLEGFLTEKAMARLLEGSGHTLASLADAARKPGFSPIALRISASIEATTSETSIHTYNLIGKLPGRNPAAGAVLLVSHWDHFGLCAEPPAEDTICNGAVDNASGVAVLTEVARRLAKGPKLDRDVYFLATTAEELGLLGAHAFADSPPVPLSDIVAAFNIDTIAIAPRGTPVAIVGEGMTGLDADISTVVKREKRKLVSGREANEYVRRQDGWALLQHDVPAVMVSSAYGEIGRIRRFFDTRYHRPDDAPGPDVELGGAAQDVALHVALVRWFGDAKTYSPPTQSSP
ncbi:MAG: M28 family peptidase [Novosphingobium sp.]|nr:M28 family peptidase [Novosphingobium sp.]